MELTLFEQDMERAHFYALGAVHQYRATDWDGVIYPLASGFSYFYTRDVSKGLAKAWDEYVLQLQALAHDKYKTRIVVCQNKWDSFYRNPSNGYC